MEISEATPVEDAKWPLWTWFAYPALAIAIGGGLGLVVGSLRQPPALPEPAISVAAEPIVAAPQPTTTPSPAVEPAPSPEIELDPEPVNGVAPRVAPKSKSKPKPIKSTRCNVYDHMNGC